MVLRSETTGEGKYAVNKLRITITMKIDLKDNKECNIVAYYESVKIVI